MKRLSPARPPAEAGDPRRPTGCPNARPSGGAEGYALIVALLALLILSVVGITLMTSVNVSTRGGGFDVRRVQALTVAEAGVAEAEARLSKGDVPDNQNPKMVSQIFLCNQGSLPAAGPDTISLATKQAIGSWLGYSKPGKGSDVLTVQYKTNADRTQILRFDAGHDPPVQTSSGTPIFTITSTGRRGDAAVKVVTEGIFKPVVPNLNAVLSGHATTTKLWCGAPTHGPFIYNGMNHSINTPTGAGIGVYDPENYVGWGDIPGFWTTSTITWGGNRDIVCCDPVGAPVPVLQNQPASQYYAGPWSSLSMSEADFYNAIGTPTATIPANMNGITYLDNNNVHRDASGHWNYAGGSGSGFLYVDGDLTVTGDFYWRGFIFVEGQFNISADIWILGGMVVNDPNDMGVQHLRTTFLYSRDAVAQCLGKGYGFTKLSYREIP
ncbi:MAG TPA: PilX N-terminal domain-containing pilus assembly protein [Candidatus Eisenbacteria bacterium]|jgi:Tfp pilus assembly protein PilX